MAGARRVPGRHLVVVGPTASGKSTLAMALAERRRGAGQIVEILSADSMAVYRGMDIGTTTPSEAEQQRVPHHLIDLVEPDQDFSVAEFQQRANQVLDDLESRGGSAILVGGTGLYVQALVDDLDLPARYPEVVAELDPEPDTRALHRRLAELDPNAASKTEPDNRRRILRALEVTIGSGRQFSTYGPGLEAYPPSPFVQVGLRTDRSLLESRIEARLTAQMEAGLLEEVRHLAARPGGISRTAARALGYRELAEHLGGERTLSDTRSMITMRTRQFGVRQIRWFRRDPRISWFDSDDDPLLLVDAIDEHWSASAANLIEDPPHRPLR